MPSNKRMQTNNTNRYTLCVAADAGRYVEKTQGDWTTQIHCKADTLKFSPASQFEPG